MHWYRRGHEDSQSRTSGDVSEKRFNQFKAAEGLHKKNKNEDKVEDLLKQETYCSRPN